MSARFPLFVPAPAKINLTLEVLGKRDDGYHELASVMQTVALHDTLCLHSAPPGECACVCDVPQLNGEDNLALRAARLLSVVDGGRHGVTIELCKAIPVQAGLGGGSSDAAAVLTGLNRLWEMRLTAGRLTELAAMLGSDVPFFVRGGTALIGGRGEVVTPLPDAEPLWLVLAQPGRGVSTQAVFGRVTGADYTDGMATRAVAEAVRRGDDLPLGRLVNGLEPAATGACGEIGEVREAVMRAGAPAVRMSGSGTAVFAPFRRLSQAVDVHSRLAAAGVRAWLTRTSEASAGSGVGVDV